MAVITVQPGSLGPSVTFNRKFYGESDEGQVRDVVDIWTDITGMNFNAMPREWKVVESEGELYIRVSLVHPLKNRANVTMYWLKETE
jgi:hypothetical protein